MNKDKDNVSRIKWGYGKYISVPTELLVNPKYNGAGGSKRVQHNSAILYGFLLAISKKQLKKDKNDSCITLTGVEIATIIGTTTSSSPRRMIQNLEEFGLIERAPFIQGQPYSLYVNDITE